MIPVDQSIVDRERGDCWSACIASILELPLEAVPKFVWHFENPDKALELWLERYGLAHARLVRYIKTTEDDGLFWHATGFNLWNVRNVHCILTGKSPNLPGCYHAVVGHIDHLGAITVAHDPSPSKKGIACAPEYIGLFVAKDPQKLVAARVAELESYRRARLCEEEGSGI